MSGLIAIVGRPNVGKSALFNRIARRRIAIVHDQPGVTRDRVSAEVEWNGRPFSLVDTGGLGLRRGEKAPDVITEATVGQVELAIEAADVIVFVVNVQEGVVPLDEEVAERLRLTRKPVLVAVNKADQDRAALGEGEFSSLGFEAMFAVSAIHGYGIDALMEAAILLLPPLPETAVPVSPAPDEDSDQAEAGEKSEAGRPKRALRLAIVGRPNVGKSSLINALTGSDRVIVSEIPGTTRDAVDVPFEVVTEGRHEQYVLIDTAGVRKARRVDSSVEFFSVERTKDAIGRCDIAILILDAEAGILEQDKKIADVITGRRRSCILVVNKWDLLEETVRRAREQEVTRRTGRDRDDRRKRLTTLAEFGEWVQSKLFFLDYAPVIFTSAKSGFQLDRLLETVRYVAAQLRQRVPTAILNRTLNDAVERRQPISAMGTRLKFFYATQIKEAPPTFLLFVNRDELLSETYTRYLAGEMRKAFGYEGCPVVLVPRARPKTIAPVRRMREKAGAQSPMRGDARPSGARPRARSSGERKRPQLRLDKARGRRLTRKKGFRRK